MTLRKTLRTPRRGSRSEQVDVEADPRHSSPWSFAPSPWPHDPAKGWPHDPANWHSTVLGPFGPIPAFASYWPSQRELELTGRYQKYIKAFAATGDPNYSGGNTWTAYDRNLDNALSLKVVGETGTSDPGPQMINGIDTSYCDFWDNNFTLDGWK